MSLKAHLVGPDWSVQLMSFSRIDGAWANLDGHEEQEILILNNAKTESIQDEFCNPGDGVDALWQVGDKGDIDAPPFGNARNSRIG